MRQKYFALQLDGALKLWESDCKLDLPEKFNDNPELEDVEEIVRTALRIANRLDLDVDEKLLTDIFSWIKLININQINILSSICCQECWY